MNLRMKKFVKNIENNSTIQIEEKQMEDRNNHSRKGTKSRFKKTGTR
jgi:hypothetical protein